MASQSKNILKNARLYFSTRSWPNSGQRRRTNRTGSAHSWKVSCICKITSGRPQTSPGKCPPPCLFSRSCTGLFSYLFFFIRLVSDKLMEKPVLLHAVDLTSHLPTPPPPTAGFSWLLAPRFWSSPLRWPQKPGASFMVVSLWPQKKELGYTVRYQRIISRRSATKTTMRLWQEGVSELMEWKPPQDQTPPSTPSKHWGVFSNREKNLNVQNSHVSHSEGGEPAKDDGISDTSAYHNNSQNDSRYRGMSGNVLLVHIWTQWWSVYQRMKEVEAEWKELTSRLQMPPCAHLPKSLKNLPLCSISDLYNRSLSIYTKAKTSF